jgi:hypothetical protein
MRRNPKEGEDGLDIIHFTCAGASGKSGQCYPHRFFAKFIRPACAHGSFSSLHNILSKERLRTVTGPYSRPYRCKNDVSRIRLSLSWGDLLARTETHYAPCNAPAC